MDLQKTFIDQITQSDERIAKLRRNIEDATADPDKATVLPVFTKLLESEQAHKLKMEEMLAKERARRPSVLDMGRARLLLVSVAVGALAVAVIHTVASRH